jgi:hypothetical protein
MTSQIMFLPNIKYICGYKNVTPVYVLKSMTSTINPTCRNTFTKQGPIFKVVDMEITRTNGWHSYITLQYRVLCIDQ